MLEIEHHVELQPLVILFLIIIGNTGFIVEVRGGHRPVFRKLIGEIDFVPFHVGSAAGEVGIAEKTEDGILLQFLIEIAKFPFVFLCFS